MTIAHHPTPSKSDDNDDDQSAVSSTAGSNRES